MNQSEKKRIVLWGDTQVGKTALLAAGLFYPDPLMRSYCCDMKGGDRYDHLAEVWHRLRTNRALLPTSSDITGISLSLMTGEDVELVDVRGGLALKMNERGVREILESSAAVLFLTEYDTPNRGDQMAAIEIASQYVGDKPKALALTKCERVLKCGDSLWDREPGWLEHTPLWSTYRHQLQPFCNSAWPTSAFGYAEREKLPAVILGEMGQSLPFRIQPKNTTKPLLYLLRKLEAE